MRQTVTFSNFGFMRRVSCDRSLGVLYKAAKVHAKLGLQPSFLSQRLRKPRFTYTFSACWRCLHRGRIFSELR